MIEKQMDGGDVPVAFFDSEVDGKGRWSRTMCESGILPRILVKTAIRWNSASEYRLPKTTFRRIWMENLFVSDISLQLLHTVTFGHQ
jgi:hypothetical protein